MKSTVADPWKSEAPSHNDGNESSMHFEDSFVSEDNVASRMDSTSRLPDSAEYLASLGIFISPRTMEYGWYDRLPIIIRRAILTPCSMPLSDQLLSECIFVYYSVVNYSFHFSENKLAKLKSKRKGKDMVKSLEEKHKSCMMNLLSNDNHRVLGDDDFILDTPANNSHPLMRYVSPDKHALTLGELVELLKADHLSQVLEQQDLDAESNIRD